MGALPLGNQLQALGPLLEIYRLLQMGQDHGWDRVIMELVPAGARDMIGTALASGGDIQAALGSPELAAVMAQEANDHPDRVAATTMLHVLRSIGTCPCCNHSANTWVFAPISEADYLRLIAEVEGDDHPAA